MNNEAIATPCILTVGELCCGCAACAAACPIGCLVMRPDNLGFYHPVLAYDGCVGCGMCESVCTRLNNGRLVKVEPQAFWAYARDMRRRVDSSSGGLFGLLATSVVGAGGVVYGASFFAQSSTVKHMRVDHLEDLDNLFTSKYIQSEIERELYQYLIADLKSGVPVLFSGTACQVAGVNQYLEKKHVDKSNLYCVDVICHGTPSPLLWRRWLSHLSHLNNREINRVNFRLKDPDWSRYSVAYYSGDALVCKHLHDNDWYMKAFLHNASIRSSCFACHAKNACGSDVTLGDYWGFSDNHPGVDVKLGVSCVMVNTDRGDRLFRQISNQIVFDSTPLSDIVDHNPSLVHSVTPYAYRSQFLEDVVDGLDMEILINKWSFSPRFLQSMKTRIKKAIRAILDGVLGLLR